MSGVHDRLKSIEARLARRGAERALLDEEIDGMLDDQAAVNLRAETDRLALLNKLEAEQNTFTTRRGTATRQEKLF